jgi:fatty acid desaturase
MSENTRSPQINISKIGVGGNLAGLLFAVSTAAIFLIGLPVLWYVFPAAIVLGGGIAVIFHFARHENPGSPWILSGTKK